MLFTYVVSDTPSVDLTDFYTDMGLILSGTTDLSLLSAHCDKVNSELNVNGQDMINQNPFTVEYVDSVGVIMYRPHVEHPATIMWSQLCNPKSDNAAGYIGIKGMYSGTGGVIVNQLNPGNSGGNCCRVDMLLAGKSIIVWANDEHWGIINPAVGAGLSFSYVLHYTYPLTTPYDPGLLPIKDPQVGSYMYGIAHLYDLFNAVSWIKDGSEATLPADSASATLAFNHAYGNDYQRINYFDTYVYSATFSEKTMFLAPGKTGVVAASWPIWVQNASINRANPEQVIGAHRNIYQLVNESLTTGMIMTGIINDPASRLCITTSQNSRLLVEI